MMLREKADLSEPIIDDGDRRLPPGFPKPKRKGMYEYIDLKEAKKRRIWIRKKKRKRFTSKKNCLAR